MGPASASGVNRPFSHLPLRIRDFASIPSSGIVGELLEAAGDRCEEDALGLGIGEAEELLAGEELGLRRGDGRGKSWSSSSSIIADGTWGVIGGDEGEVARKSGTASISRDRRRLSTSSTLIDAVLPSLTTAISLWP